VWNEYRREFCLDRWEQDDDPSHEDRVAVYKCLMDLRVQPRRYDIGRPLTNAAPETWMVDVPETDLVCVLYSIYDDAQLIDYLNIETMLPT
jgi:hypothetical protein